MMFAFTECTSTHPLTKRFELEDGRITKHSSAQMTDGHAQTVQVDDLHGLRERIDRATTNQAFMFGVLANGRMQARVVTQTKMEEARKHSSDPYDIVARTREHFNFAPQPGFMMLDHDEHPNSRLEREELLTRLESACPGLASVGKLWRPSSSYGVRSMSEPNITVSTNGQRIYLPVQNAAEIPDMGCNIESQLWANGLGWIKVSKSGQALKRTLVDTSVWQPERLDFVGPVILGEGLLRNVYTPVVLEGKDFLQLSLLTVDGDIQQRAQNAIRAAIEQARPQLEATREAWVQEHAAKLANCQGITINQASVVLRHASLDLQLSRDFMLLAQDGRNVSVGELLDNPTKWHGQRFADPLEPDYNGNDRRIAWANLLSGGQPYIHSHAHGGVRFALVSRRARILVATGERGQITSATEKEIAHLGAVFDHGDGGTAKIVNGQIRAVTRDWLADFIDRNLSFYKISHGDHAPRETPVDAPSYLALRILARHGERGFPPLEGVVTAPTLRRDGSVLDTPGYDPISRLLYVSDQMVPPKVPRHPTFAQALTAVETLFKPFRDFPFVDDTSATVLLSAILSGILRPSLPTCPAHIFDAPAAGTGKTLMAECVGIIATGRRPAIMPPTDEDNEIRKRLFSLLREGGGVILWDNISSPLGGDAFDSFLTAESFRDRVLGASESETMPNRSLLLVTGNNVSTRGDTFRRVLTCRLDAQVDTPYLRTFTLNPREYCSTHRLELVMAGLTLVRYWIQEGGIAEGAGQTASFEDWDRLVRQPLILVGKCQALLGPTEGVPLLADVASVFKTAEGEVPHKERLRDVLYAWEEVYGMDNRVSAADICSRGESMFDNTMGFRLHQAMIDAFGDGHRALNPTNVGYWLKKHERERVDGLWFERIGKKRGAAAYRLRGRNTESRDEGS